MTLTDQTAVLLPTELDHKPDFASAGLILVIAAMLFSLYMATGEYENRYGTDPITNAAQARAFADDQNPFLEELDNVALAEYQGRYHWLVAAEKGTTSQYPPGTALWAAPFYLFNTGFDSFEDNQITMTTPATYVPATAAAALSVAIAIAAFGFTMSPLIPQRPLLVSMLAAALGTGAWSVASDKLWQHGPAMMWIAIGTYFASRDRYWLSGAAFAVGIVTRPHVAVIAACIGITIAISRRSMREISILGLMSITGAVALSIYNNYVFGSFSPTGGYRLTGFNGNTTNSPLVVLERLGQSLIHERVGVLWTSPFIGLALIATLVTLFRGGVSAGGVPNGELDGSKSPDWALGAAVGGLLYLVVQFRTNRVTGGAGFFSYRYPLEALMAAGPMLAFSTWRWVGRSAVGHIVALTLVVLSVVAHGFGALLKTV